MNTFVSPFEDGPRPLDSNEQRAHEAAAPGRSPDAGAALPSRDRSEDMNGDEGAPPVLINLHAHQPLALVQRLLKVLLDSALVLHVVSARDFEDKADRLLNQGALPDGVVLAVQALAAHVGTLPVEAPAWRSAYLKGFLTHVPILVDVQHGFTANYQLVNSQGSYFYEARLMRVGGDASHFYRLSFDTKVLVALLVALDEALSVVLAASDDTSALACLRQLAQGDFPPDIVAAAQAGILLPAVCCTGGISNRCDRLKRHATFKVLFQRFVERPLGY